MGASGAGKTTLLNILCDWARKRGKGVKFSGEILVNNTFQVQQNNFGNYGAYVMQDDKLYSSFTAEDCLMFVAWLKLNKSEAICWQRVEELIAELGLHDNRKILVGADILKGNVRKLISIGCELIHDPTVIFLDEPTSGQDAFTAEKIVRILKREAAKGKIVISTIH